MQHRKIFCVNRNCKQLHTFYLLIKKKLNGDISNTFRDCTLRKKVSKERMMPRTKTDSITPLMQRCMHICSLISLEVCLQCLKGLIHNHIFWSNSISPPPLPFSETVQHTPKFASLWCHTINYNKSFLNKNVYTELSYHITNKMNFSWLYIMSLKYDFIL